MPPILQTSFVFNQRRYPGAGDIDDCWCVSSIQCVHACAPWLPLPGIPAFRKAAGDPDDGKHDGGQLVEIRRGVRTIWPVFEGRMTEHRGASWRTFVDVVEAGHPVSVALLSDALPPELKHGFGGAESYHQVSVAFRGGKWLFANPLAPVYSRWAVIDPDDIRAAITTYGRDKAGKWGCWFVAFPTAAEMLEAYYTGVDPTPYDQADIDAAMAELVARIDQAVDILKPEVPA